MTFEYLAPHMILPESDIQNIYQQMMIEYTRSAISALFEFDLWADPKNAESLYQKHYGRLGIPITEPNLWVLDSFRSIDPVYIQNYVVGASLAENIMAQLHRGALKDYKIWGVWLREQIYKQLPVNDSCFLEMSLVK